MMNIFVFGLGISCHLFLIITAVRIAVNIDGFAYIPRTLLKHSLSKIISSPLNLHHLLRINETRSYGIDLILNEHCINWSIEEWKMIQQYVKDRPRLASILIHSRCLERFYMDNRMQRTNCPIFKERYDFAFKLAPLPLNLSTQADISLFLDNINHIRDYELELWLNKINFFNMIDTCFNHKDQILKLGITRRFIFPKDAKFLSVSKSREQYLSIIESVQIPDELFGHAVHLTFLLFGIDFEERNGIKHSWNDKVKQPLILALKNLTSRLPVRNIHHQNQSAEEYCYHAYSMSKEQVKDNKAIINGRLQIYDAFNFQQLVDVITAKLNDECRGFLSEENRRKSVNCPFAKLIGLHSCLYREEFCKYFHRWKRELSSPFPCRFGNIAEFTNYFLNNFDKLPLDVKGHSLRDWLDGLQNSLTERAKNHLEIVHRQNCTYIDLKPSVSISPVCKMSLNTVLYLLISLAKQLYVHPSAMFEWRLVQCIGILANKEISLGVQTQLHFFTSLIYPYFKYYG